MPISLKISERARSKAENKAKEEEGKAASGKVPQSPPEGAARWNDYAVVWKKHRQKEEKRLESSPPREIYNGRRRNARLSWNAPTENYLA